MVSFEVFRFLKVLQIFQTNGVESQSMNITWYRLREKTWTSDSSDPPIWFGMIDYSNIPFGNGT
jgi:hypothetical protein